MNPHVCQGHRTALRILNQPIERAEEGRVSD